MNLDMVDMLDMFSTHRGQTVTGQLQGVRAKDVNHVPHVQESRTLAASRRPSPRKSIAPYGPPSELTDLPIGADEDKGIEGPFLRDIRLCEPTLKRQNTEKVAAFREGETRVTRHSDSDSTNPHTCDGPVIVVDTREQAPYDFGGRVETVRLGLPTGDYSLLGFETTIAIERKSLDDYVGSLTQGRERFLRECERLAAMPVRAVVVEGSLSEIAKGHYTSRASPASIVGSTIKLLTDYGLPVVFADTRALAERFVERMLTRHFEHTTGPRRPSKGAA